MLQLLYAWLAATAFAASLGYFLFTYAVTFGETPDPTAQPARQPILVNVALFSAFALHHSLFARTRLKALVKAWLSPRVERATYTLVSSILFTAVCWLWQPVAGVLYSLPFPWSWIGMSAQLAGVVFILLASRSVDVLDLAGVRQAAQAESDSTPLQTGGVYGFVRHPIYFGWMLLVFGAPHMTMTRFVFAVVSTAYLAIAIPWEERGLVATFGREYEDYRQRVRWRMLPGIY